MFRIDTNQARTDLYQIGKGEAQVVDFSILQRNNELAAAKEERKAAAQAKKQEDAQADIETNLAAMGKVDYMPKDRELISGKQQAYKDYVYKNIDALRKGDMKAELEAQNLQSDVMSSAAQSKNFREAWEQRGLELSKNPDQYRPESIQQHLQRASSEDAGNWNIDDSIYKKNFDYYSHVNKNLLPVAESTAKANEKNGNAQFTLGQANQAIADDVNSDPIKLEQANYDFNNAQDKLGAQNPTEFYQKKYAPKLVIKSSKPLEEWQVNGSANKNDINVTHTTTDNGGQVHVMNKTNNEEVTVDYNDKGEITGGVQGKRLTPAQKSERDKVLSANNAMKTKYDADLQKIKEYVVKQGYDASKPEDAVLISEMMPTVPQFKTVPYKEDEIPLDAQQAQTIAHDKFGIKPSEIISGNIPNNVDVQKIEKKAGTAAAKTIYADAKKAYMKKYNITDNDLNEKDLQYLEKFK